MNRAYSARRDFVYDRLVEMGLDVTLPTGTFYIFPSIKQFGLSSYAFCTFLLQKGGVAAVPGSAFTPLGEGIFIFPMHIQWRYWKKGWIAWSGLLEHFSSKGLLATNS